MEFKKRALGLDIGTKRIGIAISDAMWLGANPVCTIDRKDDALARKEIEKHCIVYDVDIVVVGVPYNMNGTFGFQAKNCVDFVKPLEERYTLVYQDERLSSETAENILKKQGRKFTKNKGIVDAVAACVILQEYLDSQRPRW